MGVSREEQQALDSLDARADLPLDPPIDPDRPGEHPELPLDPDEPDRRRALHLRPRLVACVAAGGVLGAAARVGVLHALPRPDELPLATVAVNLVGAFVLGVLLEALARRGPDTGTRRVVRLAAGTGFVGAFTTYSSFAVDIDTLTHDGRAGWALAYLAVSLLGGLVATTAGIAAAARAVRAAGEPA